MSGTPSIALGGIGVGAWSCIKFLIFSVLFVFEGHNITYFFRY